MTAVPSLAAITVSLDDVGFQAHAEVWVLVAGIIAIGLFVSRNLQPKAIAAGYEPLRWRHKAWFGAAVGSLWLVSDWPVHDVAERYLYSVHMLQHLLISMLIPAMLLLAMPRWLFELVLPPGGRAYRFLAVASRPLVAGLVFNALTALLHWSQIVQFSFESGPFHFAAHLAIFAVGLLMWMPVISPVEQWRLPPVGQCLYLFMMSLLPTVPGGWLVFAEGVVYRHYDIAERLWGVDVLSDQQAAGAIMKLVGGFFLWGVIVVIFFRWAADEMRQDEAARHARHRRLFVAKPEPGAGVEPGAAAEPVPVPELAGAEADLTFEQVEAEFARSTAPPEPSA